jgi:hypothetical protein
MKLSTQHLPGKRTVIDGKPYLFLPRGVRGDGKEISIPQSDLSVVKLKTCNPFYNEKK